MTPQKNCEKKLFESTHRRLNVSSIDGPIESPAQDPDKNPDEKPTDKPHEKNPPPFDPRRELPLEIVPVEEKKKPEVPVFPIPANPEQFELPKKKSDPEKWKIN
jgi:hypothetical protein